MKNKKYLQCIVTQHNGNTFDNPLKLGEVRLINTLATTHKSVLVTAVETHEADYKSIFG